MGATTIWERWDSMLPDGSINPGEMTSFNHYALGAVADWLHRGVAGLAPAPPATADLVRPSHPRARPRRLARHLTPYGEAGVDWRRENGQFGLEADVPVGTQASVVLPGGHETEVVEHGRHNWVVPDPHDALTAPVRTIRDVMDSPELWDRVVAAATASGVAHGEADTARRLAHGLDQPVADLVRTLAPPETFRPSRRSGRASGRPAAHDARIRHVDRTRPPRRCGLAARPEGPENDPRRPPMRSAPRTLLAELTLPEKMAQLSCYFPAYISDTDDFAERYPHGVGHVSCLEARMVDRLEDVAAFQHRVQTAAMTASGHQIPVIFHMEGLCGAYLPGATTFPSGIGRASSWDPELERAVGDIVGRQERALGITQTLAPVLDISRDSRMGRQGETYGEDPALASALGAAYVAGLQTGGGATRSDAVAKHFLGFHHSEGGIHGAHCDIPDRLLIEVYGKPFQAAITLAGLRGVMPCYSSVGGEPVSASPRLLTGLLRDQMGFDGVAVADYGAIGNLHTVHRVAESYPHAGLLALKAGLDAEFHVPLAFTDELAHWFTDGRADIALLDQAVLRVLTAKFRMGLFDHPFALTGADLERTFHGAGDTDVSLRSARESIVLLRNDGGTPAASGQAAGGDRVPRRQRPASSSVATPTSRCPKACLRPTPRWPDWPVVSSAGLSAPCRAPASRPMTTPPSRNCYTASNPASAICCRSSPRGCPAPRWCGPAGTRSSATTSRATPRRSPSPRTPTPCSSPSAASTEPPRSPRWARASTPRTSTSPPARTR